MADVMCQSEDMEESSTIRAFKTELIKTMPYFPNTKEVKEELQAQSLCSVLFHYLHWASRLIPVRPRSATVEPYLLMDTRWEDHEADVLSLLKKVKLGEDLTGHLSNKVMSKGYTPKENILAKNDSWADKDQLLNTKGFHHFHLKAGKGSKGNVVLFAQVSRETFKAVALFDHSVFDHSSNEMSHERKRMWAIFDDMVSREIAPNTAYMSNPITMSGHPIHIHSMTQQYWHVIKQVDVELSSKEFAKNIYADTDYSIPKKTKFRWLLNGLDLGVLEVKSKHFFIYRCIARKTKCS